MQEATAIALAEALVEAERTRENLINCPDEEKTARAAEYIDAQNGRNIALYAARGGQPLPPTPEPTGGGERPTEASADVALVAPPGIVITPENLERFGPVVQFRSKEHPDVIVEATLFAFDAGTAIATGEGEVATEQPTRVIRTEPLGLVTEDVFHQTYERVTDTPEQAPVSDPVSPGGPQEPPAVAQAGAEDPPAEEASDPPPSA